MACLPVVTTVATSLKTGSPPGSNAAQPRLPCRERLAAGPGRPDAFGGHALIGWWRYSGLSKLTGVLAVVSTVLAICCSIEGPGQHHPLAIVIGVVFAVLAVAMLVPAAVRAERARRHSCW